MAMKWCTKLEGVQKKYPIVFLGHPSNFKVAQDKKIADFSASGQYLQFQFTNGFEMMHKAWVSIEEVAYCFSRSFITPAEKSTIGIQFE